MFRPCHIIFPHPAFDAIAVGRIAEVVEHEEGGAGQAGQDRDGDQPHKVLLVPGGAHQGRGARPGTTRWTSTITIANILCWGTQLTKNIAV